MEENERILRDEYSHYITTVKEYIQAPHTFEQFAYEMYLATKNRIVKKDS